MPAVVLLPVLEYLLEGSDRMDPAAAMSAESVVGGKSVRHHGGCTLVCHIIINQGSDLPVLYVGTRNQASDLPVSFIVCRALPDEHERGSGDASAFGPEVQYLKRCLVHVDELHPEHRPGEVFFKMYQVGVPGDQPLGHRLPSKSDSLSLEHLALPVERKMVVELGDGLVGLERSGCRKGIRLGIGEQDDVPETLTLSLVLRVEIPLNLESDRLDGNLVYDLVLNPDVSDIIPDYERRSILGMGIGVDGSSGRNLRTLAYGLLLSGMFLDCSFISLFGECVDDLQFIEQCLDLFALGSVLLDSCKALHFLKHLDPVLEIGYSLVLVENHPDQLVLRECFKAV